MKIAMIGHKRIPSREGCVEIVVEELATRMVEKGHSVTVYNRKGKHVSGGKTVNLKEYKGVKIKSVPTFENGKLNAIVYSVIATFLALFGRYDVIHFHAEGPCSMIWLPHLFGIHTVATIHGLDWQRAKWGGFATKFLKFGEKTAAKYADELIVLSEGTRDYFKKTYGRETVFIPNGIDVQNEKKADIMQTDTDKKLVIAGGVSHSGEYAKQIHDMAKDDRIIFTGFVEGDELWELYYNCRMYVLPSDVEGMPISLLEAMACGCECLVSDIDTAKNVVGEYGYTFKKSDVNDLKNKLCEILGKPKADKAEQIEYVKNNYSWDEITDRRLELYKK